jgi:hypothetical protein
MLRRVVAFLVAIGLILPTSVLALDSKKALYVGGTITAKVAEKSEGTLDTTDEKALIFVADKGNGVARLPYDKIDSFEYGQKASHRLKTAILLTPWSLFSKKRRHYLSLIWKDEEGKDQGAVLELGKDILRPTVMVLEVKTGKKMVFQDEEAKLHFAK